MKRNLQEFKKIPKNIKILSWRLEIIDDKRFMASSLSSLLSNLFEKTHKTKCFY